MTGLIDDELLSHFPDSLKYICHNGAGFDQIDVAACTRRGSLFPEKRLIVQELKCLTPPT
jgi:lactate dehydrogenase-like 2-hydroxyacid dehydrogenase